MGAVSTFGAAQTAITIGAGATYPFDTVRRRLQMQSEKPVEVAGPPGDGDGGWESLETRPKMTGFLPCPVNCKSLYLGVGTPWNPLYYGLWHKIWLGIPSPLNVEYPQRKPPWTVVDLFLNFDPWN